MYKAYSFFVLLVLSSALQPMNSFAANRSAARRNASKSIKPAAVRETYSLKKSITSSHTSEVNLLPSSVRPTGVSANDKRNLLLKGNTNSHNVNLLNTSNTHPTTTPLIGKDGKPVLGKDNKPVMVMVDTEGKMMMGKDGKPILATNQPLELTAMPATLASLGTKFLSNLSFCGEKIPLDNQNVVQRLDQTFQRYMGLRGALSHYAKLSGRYKNEFVRTLQRQGVPAELYYLAIAESGLANRTSAQGASGFWQFMPESAPTYGLEVSSTVDERWHPQKAAVAAATYLKWLHRKFGNWAVAAGAYNMGEGAMAAAIANQNTRSYFNLQLNPETGQYVYNILTIKCMLENPGMFGIATSGKYAPIPYQREIVDYDIKDLAEFAENCDTDYETLKILNPWLIADHLEAQKGKRYEIRLPLSKNQTIVADELIPVPFSLTKTVKELRDSIVKYFGQKGGKEYETIEDSTDGDIQWSLDN